MNPLHLSIALAFLASAASAQSMNIDIGDPLSPAGGAPVTYGGVFGQPGYWNLKGDAINHSGDLRDLQNQPTSAYCWVTDGAPTDFYTDNPNTSLSSELLA